MKPAKATTLLVAVIWLLSSCVHGLPPSLRENIADEHRRLENAAQQIEDARLKVNREISEHAELFENAKAPVRWRADLDRAHETLRTAEEIDRDLGRIASRNHHESLTEAEGLLEKERILRRNALDESEAVVASADRWIDFGRDLPGNLSKMEQQYQAIHSTDLRPLATTIEKAETDWPAKNQILAGRLTKIRAIPEEAQTLWDRTSEARQIAVASPTKINQKQLATLIEASDTLTEAGRDLAAQSSTLRTDSSQLYDSWDKVLVDLDHEDDLYRERIRTIRSHFLNVAAKQTETSSSEKWVPVSTGAFHSVENNIGMSLAHKDSGLFDSEAVDTPQPAGFAYIAPESQGSNAYGYWIHDGGHSVWTWLPQYLILRELLWNHSYHPVTIDDYRGYRVAQQAGQTYYGRTAPAEPPRYGTHGSFTHTSYASSRYVQSGGFKGSAFASGSRFGSSAAEAHKTPSVEGKNGRRFGFSAGSPSGKRFGRSGGSRGFGRSFGRHR